MLNAVPEKYIPVIEGCLCMIETEMDRLYWNKNHKEPDSPFSNTGARYENNTFSVHAYDWNETNEDNFVYNNPDGELKVCWYKYLGRGMNATFTGKELTLDFLADMVNQCIKSLRSDIK